LNWEPTISLEEGLTTTYHWIAGEITKSTNLKPQKAQIEFVS